MQPELPQEQMQELPPELPVEMIQEEPDMTEEEASNVQAIMDEYGVDETTALTALAAEAQGLPIEDIIPVLEQYGLEQQGGQL